jgi:hypothetical protein
MMGYYDLVLGLIPASFVGVTGVLHGAGFELTSAVPLAALVAVALVGHALFVRAPVASTDSTDRSPAPAAD